jgi:hypothetical protein
VICLTEGDYGTVHVEAAMKSSEVIVQPADDAPVSLALTIVGSSNLRFSGLRIAELHTANARDVTFSRNTFGGTTLVDTTIATPNANLLFDSNRFDGISAGPNDYEGRLTVRGFSNTQPVGVVISNNHFGGGGCSDGVQVVAAYRLAPEMSSPASCRRAARHTLTRFSCTGRATR